MAALGAPEPEVSDIDVAVIEVKVEAIGGLIDAQEVVEISRAPEFVPADRSVDRGWTATPAQHRRDRIAALEFLELSARPVRPAPPAHRIPVTISRPIPV